MKKFKEASKELDLMRAEAIRLDRLNDLVCAPHSLLRIPHPCSCCSCSPYFPMVIAWKRAENASNRISVKPG
jgi:hypothetical protein